ncbi:hypothetical protein ACF8Q9_13970 [Pseudomonas sp. TYF_15]|jgi:hypothetical protein|uniref:hypothetical protein n=1 Tax=Pseudomonas TaxID=286 RepID=UPI001AF3C75E|nr:MULTISPECIES: hypothetical protein [Pseudomonas]MCG3645768.1 hypothetical protein [Pseudomonas putida]MDD2017470.1 hypothetical protein [Pseudomonas putida]MDD2075709.1 hypothetical protein [Pseudomonas putida]MDF3174274.1 hypothetical protein [Pseudomonas sp. ER28]MDH1928696.1 hypothetical protein [Pseudomonas sp. GD03696]
MPDPADDGRRLLSEKLITAALRQGGKAPALVFVVLRRSSAARAAHREQARSYICFGPIIPGADARVPLALNSTSWGTNKAVARAGTGDTGPKQM